MAGLLILAGALLLYMRVPSYTNDFCDPDLAGISYGANDLLAGGTIYEHCVETKPPGAYLVFAACFRLFGQRLTPIYFLAAFLHLLVLLCLARLAWQSAGPAAAVATAFFYALLAGVIPSAANCPNYESWMSFFVAFGLTLVSATQERPRLWPIVLGGAMLGIALLMKQQALLFVAVAALWLPALRRNSMMAFARESAWLALGFVLPLLAVGAVWAARGGLDTMLHDLHPGRLTNYLGASNFSEAADMLGKRLGEHLPRAWPAWLSVLVGTLLYFAYPEGRRGFGRHLLYLAAAVVAIVAGSRFFKHYMIILSAPLALAAGYAFGRAEELLAPRRWRWAIYVVAIGAALTAVRFELIQSALMAQSYFRGERMARYELVAVYTYDDNNLGNRERDESLQWIGRYIKSVTRPADGLYVWPYAPQIYFWAQRRAPTKHYMYFEVAANLPYKFGGWHATEDEQVQRSRRTLLADLEARPPRFVVFPPVECAPFCPFRELETWVQAHYVQDSAAPQSDLRVFRRAQ